jgi:hypothetical protein
MRVVSSLVGIALLAATAQGLALEPEIDPTTGLKMTGDWQLVRNNCVSCHSARLITQQSGTESHWLSLIRWMQDKQNLWQFEPETEQKIVSYLAENYPPQADRRRAPIPPELMPPNPYARELRESE